MHQSNAWRLLLVLSVTACDGAGPTPGRAEDGQQAATVSAPPKATLGASPAGTGSSNAASSAADRSGVSSTADPRGVSFTGSGHGDPEAPRGSAGAGGRDGRPDPDRGSSHWSRCAAGFRATATASVDVLRLGLACGPANGMVRFGASLTGRTDEHGVEGHHRTEPLEAGDCVRFAVAADDSVRDLEVEVSRPGSEEAPARVTVDRRWALVPEDAPLCVADGGPLAITVRTYSGGGAYSVDGWHFP